MELGNYTEHRRKALEALGQRQGPPPEQGQPPGQGDAPDDEGKGSDDMDDRELADAARQGRLHLGDSADEVDRVGGRLLDELLRTGKATDTNGDISLQNVNAGESDLVKQYLDAHRQVVGAKPGPGGINPDGSPRD